MYALGYRGQLDQQLDLLRQAAFIAQEIQAPEALYRWEWQMGRLLQARGDRPAAIAAYRRAVQTLQPIHSDLALAQTAFRETVGPVYFELADLLLQQGQLTEARDIIEQVKSAEIEDYFHDECLAALRVKAARIENVNRRTAVIYIIPLPERTELLVGLAGGLQRFTLPVTRGAVDHGSPPVPGEPRKAQHEPISRAGAAAPPVVDRADQSGAGEALRRHAGVRAGWRTAEHSAGGVAGWGTFLIEQFAVA